MAREVGLRLVERSPDNKSEWLRVLTVNDTAVIRVNLSGIS